MKTRSLYQILDDLNREIYLPHIQRPFVWGEEQVRKLLDSLLRGYPIQTLLFWRTKDEIKARRFMDTVCGDVDLHTLYDAEAWLDLTSGHEQDEDGFWYGIRFAKESPGPAWYRIANLRGINRKMSGPALGRQEARRIEPTLTGAPGDVESTLVNPENAT